MAAQNWQHIKRRILEAEKDPEKRKLIESWDIRCAKELIDKYPTAVPNSLHCRETIHVFQNDQGVWFIS